MITLTRETFKKQPPEFRIGAIVSDGMWHSLTKWRKLSKVSEEEINEWVEAHLEDGTLVQSPTGAKSYRFPLSSIYKWYRENSLNVGDQIVDFLFPPRIWDDMTETEGFLNAPLREVGIVSFVCSSTVASEIIEALRGIAKVRESEPGKYKAYSLNSSFVKEKIEEVFKNHSSTEIGKIYSRSVARRREIVDFTPAFANGLVVFYKNFSKSLVKREMETIRLFLPEPEDQESQIILWVLTAIEKFDESTSVPFSGYLNSVLKRWPYDLPNIHLGEDLSVFQRQRAKAIDSLKEKLGERVFTPQEIAIQMDIAQDKFNDLEEKHRAWTKSKTATTLTWEENSDEKLATGNLSGSAVPNEVVASDISLANKLSYSIIESAIRTGLYDDAFSILSQVDSSELNLGKIKEISEDFVQELGNYLTSMGNEEAL